MTTEVSRSHDLSERLVRYAAASAPLTLRERLEEEWLADLQTRHGLGSRLRFALGCGWASRVIALEQPGLALASAGQGRVGMRVDAPAGRTRRASSLLLVVGLHAALFYAAWSSLELIHKPKPPTRTELLPIPPQVKDPYRPNDGVNFDRVRISDPPQPVDKKIDPDPESPRVMTEKVDAGSGDLVPLLAPPRTPHRVPGAPAAGFPNVDDYYPAQAIRAGAAGVTSVQVCVNAQGRLDGDPATVQSSGFANLDAAALKLAKAGSGHYRPTTEDGRPVSSCFSYGVRFRLNNVR